MWVLAGLILRLYLFINKQTIEFHGLNSVVIVCVYLTKLSDRYRSPQLLITRNGVERLEPNQRRDTCTHKYVDHSLVGISVSQMSCLLDNHHFMCNFSETHKHLYGTAFVS